MLRLARKRWRIRAFRKRRELRPVVDRTHTISADEILVFSTLRNERVRLPYFLRYYRDLGVTHFLIVDNDSDDGSREYLAEQPDVSLWTTPASYKRSRFGVDWLNWLQMKYAHGHWCLVVDPDEFFVYPFCDTRPLRALTDWLDASSIKSFSAMLLDMYPKGPFDAQTYHEGQDPFEVAPWFDSGNYTITRNSKYGNLWIQGGPRARMFFPDLPERAPALNKIPLVKWDRDYAYVSSTHMLLPRGLNQVYDEWGGEKASGVSAAREVPRHLRAQGRRRDGAQAALRQQPRIPGLSHGDFERARPVVQVEREIHQLASAGDSGADVQGQLGMRGNGA